MNVSTHSLKAFRPKLSEAAGHPREVWLLGNFMDLHGSTSALNNIECLSQHMQRK